MANNQLNGNIGLYFVCYQLSLRGWNVMPTARNAAGVDIIIYSQDGTKMHSVQVKGFHKKNGVPLAGGDGSSFSKKICADFWVVTSNIRDQNPTSYILTDGEVREYAHLDGQGLWLPAKHYALESNREAWTKIGNGDPT